MSTATAGGSEMIKGGTIVFAGAVVESTCNRVTASDTLTATLRTQQPLEQNCSGPGVANAAVDASRPYRVDVVSISGSETDRVLQYFANYVRAADPGTANPMLMTQTYD